ncbi:MAG: ClbS/DfsB family four-helix bundle protein [Anaerolineales bacterium]
MTSKPEILAMLQSEFVRWEGVLNGLSEEQITAPNFISDWSIKDTLAHLMAWQTRSIARLEAALLDKEPGFPRWPVQPEPDPGDNSDEINVLIYKTYREEPWSVVHQSWRTGFLRFLELGQAIPEKDLLDPKRYPWMDGQSLLAVLQSSYEHHHMDHLELLLTQLHLSGK